MMIPVESTHTVGCVFFSAEDEERKKEKKKGDIISLDHLGRRT